MNSIYQTILQNLHRGVPVMLETCMSNSNGTINDNVSKIITAIPKEEYTHVKKNIKVEKISSHRGMIIREPVFPAERLIVLGAGHIAVPVCEFASRVGFSVVVCDDRPEFTTHERFPHAKEIVCDSFRNALKSLRVTEFDYVVVITRGHRFDAECLRILLPGTQPAYLGLIGSERRVKGLMDILEEEGFSRELMQNIHTPIGLDIGAVTPEEIAVAILAELIACKRKPEKYNKAAAHSDSDIELDVIRYLALTTDPHAIVTVIETKGSTPRAAGAKMAVDKRGQVVGSIGGGCSEGIVIREAIRIIGTGTYKTLDIDLTGDIAENNGMVCGGTMQVLVEDAI